jgi:OmpA-OmpF porin, OOP family
MQKLQRTFVVFSSVTAIALSSGCQREAEALPTVAAAIACADTDMDGVCNTSDLCPETRLGTRVEPAGCDCDYTLKTHFANDSADLVAVEDKAELDRLAAVMTNPKLNFVAGEIDGHTDDVGDSDYNTKLSKQRADAVASYLKSKGVVLGDRFSTMGFGSADPVADNSTEEGRASNRRVTIRRTDCPRLL